jgi:Ubiquitin interaction motif
MPLPHLGIVQPVRVCDTCYDERGAAKLKAATTVEPPYTTNGNSAGRSMQPRSARVDDESDRDLIMALQMSLEESKRKPDPPKAAPTTAPAPAAAVEEEDEDLKAAIAASLKEMEASKPKVDYGSVQPSYLTAYSVDPVPPGQVASEPAAVKSVSSPTTDGYPTQYVDLDRTQVTDTLGPH